MNNSMYNYGDNIWVKSISRNIKKNFRDAEMMIGYGDIHKPHGKLRGEWG